MDIFSSIYFFNFNIVLIFFCFLFYIVVLLIHNAVSVIYNFLKFLFILCNTSVSSRIREFSVNLLISFSLFCLVTLGFKNSWIVGMAFLCFCETFWICFPLESLIWWRSQTRSSVQVGGGWDVLVGWWRGFFLLRERSAYTLKVLVF